MRPLNAASIPRRGKPKAVWLGFRCGPGFPTVIFVSFTEPNCQARVSVRIAGRGAMFQQTAYPPILMGPYNRKRRVRWLSPLAFLALTSITLGSVLAFVL